LHLVILATFFNGLLRPAGDRLRPFSLFHFDRDLARLRLFDLRDAQLEHAVLELGGHQCFRFGSIGSTQIVH
jgi:hypothetical protein